MANEGKREKWTKDKIIKQIIEIYENNTDKFSSALLRKNYPKLNSAIYRKFKNLQNVLNECGIEYEVNTLNTWDFDSVKNYIEKESESGCKLLSKTFTSRDELLEIKCKCGEVFYTSMTYFKSNKKQQCDLCGLGKSHEQFILEIESLFGKNIKVLDRYIGGNTPINFNCVTHGDFNTKPSRVLDNILGCPKCGFEKLGESISKGKRTCDICGSDKNVQEFKKSGVNYCSKHTNQMSRYGYIKNKTIKDRNEIIIYDNYAEIILSNRQSEEVGRALISVDMIEKIKDYKWYLMSTGYVSSRSKGKAILLHRLIMNADDDINIDHINRNKFDCRNENLRKCNKSENAMNSSLSKRNTSGITGVSYSKRDKKWVAEIFAKGKKYRLGNFSKKEDAIEVRKEAEKKYFREFAPSRSETNE